MAYRKSFKRRRTKRTSYGRRKFRKSGRRRKNSRATTGKQKSLLFADRQLVKFKYTQLVANFTGATASYEYRGNSIYDPDYTGTGTTVAGHSSWKDFYSRYRVHGSKIKVTVINDSTADQVVASIVARANSDADQTMQTYATNWVVGSRDSGKSIATRKQFMATKKVWGQKTIISQEFSAGIDNSPTNQWWWTIDLIGVDGNLDCHIWVEIVYYTELYQRRSNMITSAI